FVLTLCLERRGEYGRDEQLVRVPEVERALRVGILGVQAPDHLLRARPPRGQALPPGNALRSGQPAGRLLLLPLRAGRGALLHRHQLPFRAKYARTSSSCQVFTTWDGSSQPLRATLVPKIGR